MAILLKATYDEQDTAKEKWNLPLISSKNVSKTSNDLRKMIIIDTDLYLNPLALILKHLVDHTVLY